MILSVYLTFKITDNTGWNALKKEEGLLRMSRIRLTFFTYYMDIWIKKNIKDINNELNQIFFYISISFSL